MDFEDIYRGYVIREKKSGGYFIDPDTDRYRVFQSYTTMNRKNRSYHGLNQSVAYRR